jgi:hypothetical protein
MATIVGAAILLLAEGAGLLGVAVWQALAWLSGDVESPVSTAALLVLTLVGAAALVAFGIAVLRGQSWGRSGGVVFQLLILAVALGAITGEFAHPGVALALAAPAVICLVLLVIVARRAGRADRAAARNGED